MAVCEVKTFLRKMFLNPLNELFAERFGVMQLLGFIDCFWCG